MNKKPNIPLVKFKNFNTVWISDQVKNLFEISRGQSLTKNQIKTKPVERERERAATSIRFILRKQKIRGF
ncbi:hypothetical protein R7X46_02210 [Mesomycoplasma ovipneumoniae]|uniref:hypothetical protein n=1 Tax=Mesomycoplasma ovipneumoniae TaxID=29562 RepID=UPI0029646E74|nr:hypothetical protein [Mesomycoplasma ovipneumoniae]MDW2932079.1 hypothetical protein [Mesomycoplasma ovipneumoniae]